MKMKKYLSLTVTVALFTTIIYSPISTAADGGNWKTATATVTITSDGNLEASGIGTEEVQNEIVSIDSYHSDNGDMNVSFSGKKITAKWTGGDKTNTETWIPATSNTYYGSGTPNAVWKKELPQKVVRNVEARVTPNGTAAVSGNVISFTGNGAENTNTNWNSQSVTASANNGDTDQKTSGYGVVADEFALDSVGAVGDVVDHTHNYNEDHVYAKVVTSKPTSKNPTAGSAYTVATYQKYYYVYHAAAAYEYLAEAGTYNYSGTVTYTFKYQAEAGIPIVAVTNDAPTPLYRGTKVTFTGTAADSSGEIVSKKWSGITSGSGDTATYTPKELGTFTAIFTATNDAGKEATGKSTIKVINKPPTASIGAEKLTLYRGEELKLTGYAKDEDGTIVSTKWTGAINGSATQQVFKPNRLGTYKVTFTAKDNDGASASDSVTITVKNHAPTVTLVTPNGTKEAPANYKSALKWKFKDEDNDPQTSYRVQIYTAGGGTKLVDTGQVMSSSQSYNPAVDLVEGNIYRWNVTVTDPWDQAKSKTGYFKVPETLENYAVVSVTPVANMVKVSDNPDVSAFIVGQHGPKSFKVNVRVQKTAGSQESARLNLRLVRSGYGTSWSTSKSVNVGKGGTTVTFTVPNINDSAIRSWQGSKVTKYQPFTLQATLSTVQNELSTDDNTLSSNLRTAEYGRSQLTD